MLLHLEIAKAGRYAAPHREKDGDSCRMNVRKQQTRRSVRHAREVRRRSERLGGIDMKPVEASFLGYVNRGDVDLTRLLEAIR